VHQELCAPEENCEEGTGDTELTDEELIKTDTEVDEKETVAVEEPPLEWYPGVPQGKSEALGSAGFV
jgi:hypothetical protein